MNFTEQEHITMLRDTLRRFIKSKFTREQAREWDQKVGFPKDVYRELSELGIMGFTVPEEYGGLGVDITAALVCIEELSCRGTFLSGPYIHCAFYGGMNITENGNEEQKRELLPKLAAGELLFAYGLSEPDVGADLASVKVKAEVSSDGKSIVINGTKRWCTAARDADYILTLACTDPIGKKYRNLSLILVPTSSDGISIVDIKHTGFHYAETTDVIFDNVRVPIENILGGPEKLNKGWGSLVGRTLDVERLETAALAYGIAKAAVNDAWVYAQERKQFGRPICAHQAIRHSLSDVKTKLEACRLILYNSAAEANSGGDCAVSSSMAKLFVADTACEIVLECQRIMGAYGYAQEYDMERHVRDIIIIPIAGGSSNIQKNNIANRLGLPT